MNRFGIISVKRGGRCGDTPSSLEVVMTEKDKILKELDNLYCDAFPPSMEEVAEYIIARDKKKRGEEITLDSLKANPMYDHINVQSEYDKAKQWTFQHGRKLTPRFFVNWLNRIEKPLEAKKCNQIQMEAF